MSAPQFLVFLFTFKTDTYVIDSVVHSLDPIQGTTWSFKGFSAELQGINRQKDFWLLHSLQTISFGHKSFQVSNFSQLEMIGGMHRFFSLSQVVPYGHSILYMNFYKSTAILQLPNHIIKMVIYVYQSLIPVLSRPLHGSSSQILRLHLSYHKQCWSPPPCGSRTLCIGTYPHCIGSHRRSLEY